MIDEKKLKSIIQSVLEERFEGVEIISIDIEPDFDEYGGKILLVKVVFNAAEMKLDAEQAAGVLRHLLPKIYAAGESGFPVLSFIAASEAGKAKAATN